MLRGKPFHHFRGKLLYHFLRGRGVNKIFVLFPQSLVLQGFSGTKKDLAEKNLQGLFLYSVLPFFLCQALPRISQFRLLCLFDGGLSSITLSRKLVCLCFYIAIIQLFPGNCKIKIAESYLPPRYRRLYGRKEPYEYVSYPLR